MRGLYNFDTLRFDFYLDADTALEAFKADAYTLRRERDAEKWVSGAYDFPAVQDGRVTMLTLPHFRPVGMMGLAMNTRRPIFTDPRVRRALILAFDFEWINKTLLGGQYKRDDSYFANSALAATGIAAGGGAAAAGAVPRPAAAAAVHRALHPAAERRQRPQPRESAGGAGAAGRGRLGRSRTMCWSMAAARRSASRSCCRTRASERIALAYADQLRRLGIQADDPAGRERAIRQPHREL